MDSVSAVFPGEQVGSSSGFHAPLYPPPPPLPPPQSGRAQRRMWRSVSSSARPLPLQEHQKEEDPRRAFEEPTDTPLWVVSWQMLKPHSSIQAGGASFSSAFVPLPLVSTTAGGSVSTVLSFSFEPSYRTFCRQPIVVQPFFGWIVSLDLQLFDHI